MDERFLHYLWLFRRYSSNHLVTLDGKKLKVLYPGLYNHHEGPDFADARIEIDGVAWAGNVEIHVHSSDWIKHGHQHQSQYQNIILHVVWEHDQDIPNFNIPTLQLKSLVSEKLLEQYHSWLYNDGAVPCQHQWHLIPDIIWKDWKDSLLLQRWEQKSQDWNSLYEQVNRDWRRLLFVKLAENFGFKVNAFPMRLLALSIPLNIVEKLSEDQILLDALFFGQAGLLFEQYQDEYPRLLAQHYQYLRKRFDLSPLQLPWKFLRMRPSNFPTIRLAQFSALMANVSSLFANLLDNKAIEHIKELLHNIELHEYWKAHYHFKKSHTSTTSSKKLGEPMIQNILINTFIPFKFFFGKIIGDQKMREQSIDQMHLLPPEMNAITKLAPKNQLQSSADSQAFIQLYNHYCSLKKCLDCRIGIYLLRTQ